MAELRSGVAWDALKVPDEEYLKVAVTRLLPAYYGAPPDEGAGAILRRMADAFVERHRDTWLLDVIKTRHSRVAGDAFAALGRAVDADGGGDWARSSLEAERAEPLFRSVGSEAGVLGSRSEKVRALQGLYKYGQCASEAGPLTSALSEHSYSWLRTETLLESAICERPGIDFERTWSAHETAIQLAKQYRYPVLLLRALGLSAMWQTDIGDAALAWRQYMQGLELYWTAKYPLIRGQFFYAELSWLPQVSAPSSAAAWARENVEITASLGFPSYRAGALHLLALDEISLGLRDTAMEHLAQGSSIAAALPGTAQGRQLSMYETFDLAEIEARLGELDGPLARLLGLQKEVEPGDKLLQLRLNTDLGRLRLRRGEYAEARGLLQRALEAGSIARATVSEKDRWSWAHSMGDSYRAMVECEIRSGADPGKSWALWSSYRSALLDREPTPRPVSSAVAPGEAVLSFAELPSGVGAWLGTSHGYRFRWVEVKMRQLEEATTTLLRSCATDRSPEPVLIGDARQISQWLLGPWESELDGVHSVVIESDGAVASLPWPALVRSNNHYWSEDFAIHTRAGNSFQVQQAAPPNIASFALVVGDPALDRSALPPLPDARREAEKVSLLFPRSLLLVGQQATLSEVQNRIESAEVFHFAGHGYGGDGGGLILRGAAGGPAMLRASDIRDLHLSHCRLAVLSGCATGSGELNGPGDPQSLVRAFLHAGTRQVVASFWNLSSASTEVFMDALYTELRPGVPIEDAMRSAAARVRARREYHHPYYWAGLQLFGLQ